MLVEESSDFLERVLGVRRGIVAVILRVRLAFEDLQHGFYARLAELAMHAYGVAQQEVARAAGQYGGRKALYVAIDRREKRILQVVAVRIHLRSCVAEAVGRHEYIVEHGIGDEGVANHAYVGHWPP